ncbi:hypothetical protein [Flavobacterium sp. RSSB_23]|jgi:hypothetical protein|uniref:hypothetical protein n=1 Tax=Flavobacterium sp. RSSB_23 TaxID=3447668 RepID=UPI003F40DFBE
MDTAVTIIGFFITLLIAIPLYFVIRGNSINKKKIKAIQALYNPENTFDFEETEKQNKKVFSIDKKNKAFLFIDFNPKETLSKFIDLNQIVGCHMLYTTDSDSNKTVKIEFELLYKHINHKEVFTVYDATFDPMNQICLFEDEKLAKNWRQKINSLLV